MSFFALPKSLSAINESHQITISGPLGEAICLNARMRLVPFFRSIVQDWEDQNGNLVPVLSNLAQTLFYNFYHGQTIHLDDMPKIDQLVSTFIKSLDRYDKEVLGFYFLGNESRINELTEQRFNSKESENATFEEDCKQIGEDFKNDLKKINDEQLHDFLVDELYHLIDIIGGTYIEMGADEYDIEEINANFCQYLEIPIGLVSLIEPPIDILLQRRLAMNNETRSVLIMVHKPDDKIEPAECWLMPNGLLEVKGSQVTVNNYETVISTNQQNITRLLRDIEEHLVKKFDIAFSDIHYSFRSNDQIRTNLSIEEGLAFIADLINSNCLEQFEAEIRINLVKNIQGDNLIWGGSFMFSYQLEIWQEESEIRRHSIWLLKIEDQKTPLETEFTSDQCAHIQNVILAKITQDYLQYYDPKDLNHVHSKFKRYPSFEE